MEFNLHYKQTLCLTSEATEILYGGAAGGGKSHCMRTLAIAYAGFIPNIQIYLFRRKTEDLKKNHLYGKNGFLNILSPLIEKKIVKINESTGKIAFKNGSMIHLCHCQHEKDVYNYQGAEIDILLIDELTHFTDFIYKFLRARCRTAGLVYPANTPDFLPRTLPRIICGSNPGGVGHEFVKSEFIDNKDPLKIYKMDPEEGGMTRQFIPAKLNDNPTMTQSDPNYKHKLLGLGGALARAMLDGDWDAIEGAYFDTFNKDTHIIPRFEIPKDWFKIRGFDWGYSAPFGVLWAAISDGSLINIGGKEISLPRGSLIFYREYYGWTGKPNKGLKMELPEIAKNTMERQGKEKMNRQVADPAIFDESKKNMGMTQAEELAKYGCIYERADNKRVAGWQQIRTRLTGKDGRPLMYITEDCKNLIRTLPIMQYDRTKPEDLDTALEDHLLDVARYIAMSRPITIDIKEALPDPTQDFWENFNPHQVRKGKKNKNYE
jgi:hypothetical protein